MTTTAVHRPPSAAPLHVGGRYWEIDVARTVAILMMVAYHTVYDVDLLAPGFGPDPFAGAWGALPEATGTSFLLVVGISLAVADGRMRTRRVGAAGRLRRHLRHAGVVLAAGAVVSVATLVVFDDRFVRFGILQLIGVAIVVGAFTVQLGPWNLVPGLAAIGAGLLASSAQTDSPLLGIAGFDQRGFSSVDHWPLLPWLGPMLIGIAIGSVLYPGGRRAPMVARATRAAAVPDPAGALGRRSLLVYLVHQLLLIPFVWVALVIVGADVPWPL